MEIFTWAKLRILSQEEPLRKPWELFHPLEVEAQLYEFLETEGCAFDDIWLAVYTVQICKYKVMGHCGPYNMEEECFL